jgi:DNA glycosylase AlkZ-like
VAALAVDRGRAIAYRLRANRLDRRLSPGSLAEAARFGLQDTIPRSALISLHARVEACVPDAWEDRALVQVWSPRSAVHVVPAEDRGVFTLGRFPRDPAQAAAVRATADQVARLLERPRRKTELMRELGLARRAFHGLFTATIAGTVAIRWDTRDTIVRAVPAPAIEVEDARRELCRRHLRAFGPSTPRAFAWWAGIAPDDAAATWRALAPALVAVQLAGTAAWILAEDEAALRTAAPVAGVRFLPAEELKLFGQDRSGLFAGPTTRTMAPPFDTHHPSGLMVNGELAGAWGRRGGRVEVRPARALAPATRTVMEDEVGAMPIPGVRTVLTIGPR